MTRFDFRRNASRNRAIRRADIARRAKPYAALIAGASARKRGMTRAANPHKSGTDEFRLWEEGYSGIN